jgi:hypothetical protein
LRAATASSSLDTCSACSTYTSSPAGGNRPAGSVSVPTQFQLRVAAGQQSGASTHARTQRQYTGPRLEHVWQQHLAIKAPPGEPVPAAPERASTRATACE